MKDCESSEITNKVFWEEYWSNIALPISVDYNFKNDRVIAEIIKKFVKKVNYDKMMVEIGCAPGKWLTLFNKELCYCVEGYEYIKTAAEKTKKNLILNGIPVDQFQIYVDDFVSSKISLKYDVVVSLGFIEHFQNYDQIMKKHLEILKDGGILIIGVPNFTGINYFIQRIIDFYSVCKILPKHNLKTMNLDVYRNFVKNNNLRLIFNNYIGGFEPALFNSQQITNRFIRLFVPLIIKFSSVFFGKINTQITSGYMMAVFRKQ